MKVQKYKDISLDKAIFETIDTALSEIPVERQSLFIIKPNLVSDYPPPITTPVDIVEATILALRELSPGARIIIGEGTASISKDTWDVFRALGYVQVARRHGVELMDLNEAQLLRLRDERLTFFKEIWLPEMVFEGVLISIPVLKAHTLATVTLSMKNMMGLLPPSHYQESGHWKKSYCHRDIHQAIYELNLYRTPDITILDARRGLHQSHLAGPEMDPPPGVIAGGVSAPHVDAYGAGLLGRDWRQVDHIRLALEGDMHGP